jgi:hypothetical protein
MDGSQLQVVVIRAVKPTESGRVERGVEEGN